MCIQKVLTHFLRKLKARSTNWLISIISSKPWLAYILSRKINFSDQYPLKLRANYIGTHFGLSKFFISNHSHLQILTCRYFRLMCILTDRMMCNNNLYFLDRKFHFFKVKILKVSRLRTDCFRVEFLFWIIIEFEIFKVMFLIGQSSKMFQHFERVLNSVKYKLEIVDLSTLVS